MRFRQHRHLFAVAAQMTQDCAHLSTTPVPTTSILTLASMGGGLRLCWRTMSGGGVSPSGSIVRSTSWPRNSVAITVADAVELFRYPKTTVCNKLFRAAARPSPGPSAADP